MSDARFVKHVHMTHPETMAFFIFQPGDEVPDWVFEKDPLISERLYEFPGTYSPEETDIAYANLNVSELKALLATRGLATSGTKQELIDRLEENDLELALEKEEAK